MPEKEFLFRGEQLFGTTQYRTQAGGKLQSHQEEDPEPNDQGRGLGRSGFTERRADEAKREDQRDQPGSNGKEAHEAEGCGSLGKDPERRSEAEKQQSRHGEHSAQQPAHPCCGCIGSGQTGEDVEAGKTDQPGKEQPATKLQGRSPKLISIREGAENEAKHDDRYESDEPEPEQGRSLVANLVSGKLGGPPEKDFEKLSDSWIPWDRNILLRIQRRGRAGRYCDFHLIFIGSIVFVHGLAC